MLLDLALSLGVIGMPAVLLYGLVRYGTGAWPVGLKAVGGVVFVVVAGSLLAHAIRNRAGP